MTRLVPMTLLLLLALPGSALSTPPAESTGAEPAPTVVYKATTEIDIEDVRVDAETSKPLGAGVTARRTQVWTPLLRLRPDFNAEMVESVTAIR